MHIDLSRRTAVVTGSTEGIGLAVARGLAAAGADVVLNGRTPDKVEDAAATLREAFPAVTVRGVAADLATAKGCASLVEAVPRVDILVSNAGVFRPMDFFDTPDEEWDRHWQVNVMSGVRLARAWLPAMAEAGWGRVVFLGSESAFNIPVEMIHYGVSKTADVAVARGLAKRMAGTGVTVNSVLPGPTASAGVEAMMQETHEESGRPLEEIRAQFVRDNRPSSIIGRLATVEEVANLVVYAVSEQASATTGASLRVDGGIVDTL